MEPHERIILALDCSNPDKAIGIVESLMPHVGCIKKGFEYLTAHLADTAAPTLTDEQAIANTLKHLRLSRMTGTNVLLDLKLHDIPKTVTQAVRNTIHLCRMVNLHCAGASDMMRKAKEAIVDAAKQAGVTPPLVLGVTLLTSLSYEDLVDVGFAKKLNIADLEERERIERDRIDHIAVHQLAYLAQESGLDGIICSPKELSALRKYCQPEFLAVTPGIRPSDSSKDDQKRTMTPYEAIMEGADYLVIGRPITKAEKPVEAAKCIADEIGEALVKRGE